MIYMFLYYSNHSLIGWALENLPGTKNTLKLSRKDYMTPAPPPARRISNDQSNPLDHFLVQFNVLPVFALQCDKIMNKYNIVIRKT